MTSPIKGNTPNYGFNLINVNTPRWASYEHDNWSLVDALFTALNVVQIKGFWANSTVYIIGDRVLDAANGSTYLCQVNHTSAASGTFLTDRTANPTYWILANQSVAASAVAFTPAVGKITTASSVQNAIRDIEDFTKALDDFIDTRLTDTRLIFPVVGATYGGITVNRGFGTNPGFIEFFSADSIQRGYIGHSTGANRLGLVSLNGWYWDFNAIPTVNNVAVLLTSGGTITGNILKSGSPLITDAEADAQYSLLGHGHVQSDITGLVTTLANKYDKTHTAILDNAIEINQLGTGDRTSVLDFHSSGTPSALDYSARVMRVAGVNGAFELVQVGTGPITLSNSTTGKYVSLNSDTFGLFSGTRLYISQQGGDEGGEIILQRCTTNTSLTHDTVIDQNQNSFRFFVNGGTTLGAYLNLASCATGIGSEIVTSTKFREFEVGSDTQDLGKFVFAAHVGSAINLGTLVAGSDLRASSHTGNLGATLTGTWRCAGQTSAANQGTNYQRVA